MPTQKPTGELTSKLTKADLEKVTDLDLSFTQITDAGLKDISKLQKLTSLNLGLTPEITDAGLKDVAKLQQLTVLRLDDTKITYAVLKNIAKLQKLEKLDLHQTKITYENAPELRKALSKCEIRHSCKED